MAAGKLTIQAWHEAREREAKIDEISRELTREIVKLVIASTPRRKPSMLRRFIRSMTF